jgi:hypothetical protein
VKSFTAKRRATSDGAANSSLQFDICLIKHYF